MSDEMYGDETFDEDNDDAYDSEFEDETGNSASVEVPTSPSTAPPTTTDSETTPSAKQDDGDVQPATLPATCAAAEITHDGDTVVGSPLLDVALTEEVPVPAPLAEPVMLPVVHDDAIDREATTTTENEPAQQPESAVLPLVANETGTSCVVVPVSLEADTPRPRSVSVPEIEFSHDPRVKAKLQNGDRRSRSTSVLPSLAEAAASFIGMDGVTGLDGMDGFVWRGRRAVEEAPQVEVRVEEVKAEAGAPSIAAVDWMCMPPSFVPNLAPVSESVAAVCAVDGDDDGAAGDAEYASEDDNNADHESTENDGAAGMDHEDGDDHEGDGDGEIDESRRPSVDSDRPDAVYDQPTATCEPDNSTAPNDPHQDDRGESATAEVATVTAVADPADSSTGYPSLVAQDQFVDDESVPPSALGSEDNTRQATPTELIPTSCPNGEELAREREQQQERELELELEEASKAETESLLQEARRVLSASATARENEADSQCDDAVDPDAEHLYEDDDEFADLEEADEADEWAWTDSDHNSDTGHGNDCEERVQQQVESTPTVDAASAPPLESVETPPPPAVPTEHHIEQSTRADESAKGATTQPPSLPPSSSSKPTPTAPRTVNAKTKVSSPRMAAAVAPQPHPPSMPKPRPPRKPAPTPEPWTEPTVVLPRKPPVFHQPRRRIHVPISSQQQQPRLAPARSPPALRVDLSRNVSKTQRDWLLLNMFRHGDETSQYETFLPRMPSRSAAVEATTMRPMSATRVSTSQPLENSFWGEQPPQALPMRLRVMRRPAPPPDPVLQARERGWATPTQRASALPSYDSILDKYCKTVTSPAVQRQIYETRFNDLSPQLAYVLEKRVFSEWRHSQHPDLRDIHLDGDASTTSISTTHTACKSSQLQPRPPSRG